MPTVKLKVAGWLGQSLGVAQTGQGGISISVPEGETIPGLARRFAAQNDVLRRVLFAEKTQEFGGNVLVTLNGCLVNPHDRSEALLKEGDEVVFLPAIDGG